MGSKNLGALHLATQASIIKTHNNNDNDNTTTNNNDDTNNINTQVGISLKQSP